MALRKDRIQLDVEINGRKANSTFGDLTKTARQLKNELKQLTPGTNDFIKKSAELKKVNSRIAEVREQTKGVTEAQMRATKATSVWSKALKGLSVLGLVVGAKRAIGSLFRLGKESLNLFDQQAKANAQLQAVIESTEGAAGRSLEQLQKSARELQKVSLFGDEQVQQAQGVLLTFTRITGEVFDRTTPAVLDYATALGVDLKSASIQVGKALNDPILGVSALGRAGVQFTVSQKAMIKSLQDGGDTAGAQAIILKELETQFKGSAQAAAEAGLGGFQQLRNRLSDVQESFGELIQQGLVRIQPFLRNVVTFVEGFVESLLSGERATGRFSGAINGTITVLKAIGVVIRGAVAIWNGITGAIGAVIDKLGEFEVVQRILERAVDTGLRFIDVLAATPRFIKENRESLLALVVALVSFNSASIAAAASTLGAVAAQKLAVIWNRRATFSFKALNVAMKANPIGFIIGLVATLVAGFIALYNRSERVRATIAGLGAVASEAFGIVKKSISLFLDGIKQLKNGDFSAAATSFRDALRNSNPFGEGQRLATAFNKGFKNKLEQESADAAIVPVEVKPFVGDTPVTTSADIVENIKIDDTNVGTTPNKTVERKDDSLSILEALALAAKKAADKRLDILRNGGELELTEIRKQFLQRMFTEEEFNRLTLEQKAKNTQRELDVLESLGLQGTQAYRDAELAKLEIAKEISDQRIEVAEREAEVQMRLQEGGKQALNDFVDVAIEALGRDEEARKKNATAIKAFQKAKVVTNLFSEISGYFNTYSTIPGGQIIAGILSGIAGARAGLAISSINKQKFKKGGGVKFGQFGGSSHENGGVDGVFSDGTRVNVERDEKFFVVNKKNSPLISFLNGVNTLNGNGVPLMRNGGALDFQLSTANTTPNVPLPQQSSSPSIDMSGISEMFGQFLGAFQKIVQNAPPAQVVYEHIVDINNEVNELENKTAL